MVSFHGVRSVGARVKVDTETSLTSSKTLFSDENGHCELGNLSPDERVRVRVFHADFPAWQVWRSPPSEGDWHLEVPAGQLVRGRVVDSRGNAVTDGHAFLMTPRTRDEIWDE